MNSLKNRNQDDQRINIQSLGSWIFDWATLAGLNSLPELGPGSQAQAIPAAAAHGHVNNNVASCNNNDRNNVNAQNNMYVPSFPQAGHVDEEVQSGLRRHRAENSSFFQHNANPLVPQTHSFHNSVDPFGIRYSPTQTGIMGFRL